MFFNKICNKKFAATYRSPNFQANLQTDDEPVLPKADCNTAKKELPTKCIAIFIQMSISVFYS